MRLRPLNDTVIIEVEGDLMAVDTDQKVLDAVKSGIIALPDKNMLMKISNHAKVVSASPKCHYRFKPDQRIIYDQFADTPVWVTMENKKYRIIKEHYVKAVYEDAK